MPRISLPALGSAIQKVRAMNMQDKERLADELFLKQPNMLGSVLALSQMGVSFEKVGFALDILFTCFQAMKESGLNWPIITEEDQDKQLGRYVAIVKFSEDLGASFEQISMKQYIASHPEQLLLAFVTGELKDWLEHSTFEKNDGYVMLNVTNLVNCIAFVTMPALKR
jgi:hypothetical protein